MLIIIPAGGEVNSSQPADCKVKDFLGLYHKSIVKISVSPARTAAI